MLAPLILYVTVIGKVRGLVNVMLGEVAFWQIVVEPLIITVGVGRTVTMVEAEADGPLHPLAVTLTVAVPEKCASHVTVPVVPVPEIVLPVPVIDQL